MKIDRKQRPSLTDKAERVAEFDEWDRFMVRTEHDDYQDKYNELWNQKGWLRPSCIPISIILVLIVLVVLLPLLDASDRHALKSAAPHPSGCLTHCRMSLVESLPEGLEYNVSWRLRSTFDVWRSMIAQANHTIEIGSYYWTLRSDDVVDGPVYPGTDQGEAIFSALMATGLGGKVKVRIAQNQPTRSQPNLDTDLLARKGAAEVVNVNMPRLVGSGILHTKMWIVDRDTAYIGSANLDWRSLTQVKELGVLVSNCSCLLKDISKIFDIYWKVGKEGRIPDIWPAELDTSIDATNPVAILVNGTRGSAFISSSPPPLCTKGRTTDIDSILDTIKNADKYIYISVMDYMPLMIYTPKPKFWPVIDDALRAAAVDRRISIRLLISSWNHTHAAQPLFLRSLQDISNSYRGVDIHVKLFSVPATEEQKKIPFARVNHNKYMVTDNTAYIGTSNWSGDYFTVTGGVGLILEGNTTIRKQLEDVFMRDWESIYSRDL